LSLFQVTQYTNTQQNTVQRRTQTRVMYSILLAQT